MNLWKIFVFIYPVYVGNKIGPHKKGKAKFDMFSKNDFSDNCKRPFHVTRYEKKKLNNFYV